MDITIWNMTGGIVVIKKEYPDAEYGILTNYLNENDIRSVIARQYRTTNEQVELMDKPEISAVVRTIVRYEDQDK